MYLLKISFFFIPFIASLIEYKNLKVRSIMDRIMYLAWVLSIFIFDGLTGYLFFYVLFLEWYAKGFMKTHNFLNSFIPYENKRSVVLSTLTEIGLLSPLFILKGWKIYAYVIIVFMLLEVTELNFSSLIKKIKHNRDNTKSKAQ